MKITNEMVNEFNSMLKTLNCVFKLELNEKISPNNPTYEIKLVNPRFVDSFIINPTKDFFKILNEFFEEKGIELSYNNTGSIFWSRHGFED